MTRELTDKQIGAMVDAVPDALTEIPTKRGTTLRLGGATLFNLFRWCIENAPDAATPAVSDVPRVDAPPSERVPEQNVVAKVRDDNGHATLITLIDDDGDAHLRIVSEYGDVDAEFCTKRGGGQDPDFTRDVRAFIGAVQRSVSRRHVRRGEA